MKQIIFTGKAPAPIGPYSQAILTNNTLYSSGQIALDPVTGELITDSIENETKQVMENIKAILKAADMSFSNVIKSTIFISNMDDFAKINHIYGAYFDEKTAPARETVQISRLPKNANVEISIIAIK